MKYFLASLCKIKTLCGIMKLNFIIAMRNDFTYSVCVMSLYNHFKNFISILKDLFIHLISGETYSQTVIMANKQQVYCAVIASWLQMISYYSLPWTPNDSDVILTSIHVSWRRVCFARISRLTRACAVSGSLMLNTALFRLHQSNVSPPLPHTSNRLVRLFDPRCKQTAW